MAFDAATATWEELTQHFISVGLHLPPPTPRHPKVQRTAAQPRAEVQTRALCSVDPEHGAARQPSGLCATCYKRDWVNNRETPDARVARLTKMRERIRNTKKMAADYLGGKCAKCGLVDDPCVYDFHHKDPREKDGLVSRLVRSGWTRDLVAELDKCELLCAHCHRKTERDLADAGISAKAVMYQHRKVEAA